MERPNWFEPQPTEVPLRMPSPFGDGTPHPLAHRAALALHARLGQYSEGKMFGVLVVRDPSGPIGWIAGFSGMLDGAWEVDGFAPPLFDLPARQKFWVDGEAELDRLSRQIETLPAGSTDAEEGMLTQHHAELEALAQRHRENRSARAEARARGEAAADLDQQSRADKAEKRRLRERQALEALPCITAIQARKTEYDRLVAARSARSAELLDAIQATYRVPLAEIFQPAVPPGGTGDCAGPKLLGYAAALGLAPVALTEFWWGDPPPSGGRHHGIHYPACRGKCGPLLRYMLDGVPVEPAAAFVTQDVAESAPEIVYEDQWLIVVHKPAGMLSVPGRNASAQDSALTRLRIRYPNATGPLLVHRLDLDTSGLLLMARTLEVHGQLQRLFAQRKIRKTYVAVLDGDVHGDAGRIALALRGDPDDRPRQIHDPSSGKAAVTDWRVLSRQPGQTRVILHPQTGRTHQLRVHAAHPAGLNVPIVGDRLYGRRGGRLMLHAQALAFEHPVTGRAVEITRNTPF